MAALSDAGAHVVVPARRPEVARQALDARGLSSSGHNSARCDSTIRKFTTGYDKWKAYGQAKTADSLFAVHLDALGASHGVRAFAAHPGGIMTEL